MRVLLLSSTTSYRTEDFLLAAEKLGVEALLGTDRCHKLAEIWPRAAFGGSLALELRHEDDAVAAIVDEARRRPLAAIVPTDELTADVAARASERLGLRGNSPAAAAIARNKRKLRQALAAAGLPGPRFSSFDVDEDAAAVARSLRFPAVIKPLLLSASRGVMRVDSATELVTAWRRLAALLATPALRAVEDPDGRRVLIESFVPGREVALEGLVGGGELTALALFDKPDPLDGPFFEETLYVTPSRHPPEVQRAIVDAAARAARAIGLRHGPVHAELRLAPEGPVVIEVAARSIGGRCARTLRFGLGGSSLEELVLRHALGQPLGAPGLVAGAAGVMMLPIPAAGVLAEVRGLDEARRVPLIEDIEVSVKVGETLVPLPEGSSYLGFAFARGDSPVAVEDALRRAHAKLAFCIKPMLPSR